MSKNKIFKNIDNPAFSFISKNTDDNYSDKNYTDTTYNTDNTFNTLNKDNTEIKNKSETKSKRINLLIKKSTHEKLSKIAYMQQDSFNNYVNKLMDIECEKNISLIEKYDDIFKK